MPDYLAEADWKTVLNKPKNLGLRAQKTGVSEKLRGYGAANDTFEKTRSADNATDALKALRALKKQADDESKVHKAFTEATTYLKQIVAAAGKRELELLKDIGSLGSVDIIVAALDRAKEYLKAVKSASEYQNSDTKSLVQSLRAIGASCSKVPELAKFGKLAGTLTATESLSAVTDENLAAKKKDVATFLIAVQKGLDSL